MEVELVNMHECLEKMRHVDLKRSYLKEHRGSEKVRTKLEADYDQLGDEFIQLIEDYLISLAQPVEPYTLPKAVVMDMGPLGVELDGELAQCGVPPISPE